MLQISHGECGALDQRVPQAEIDRDTQHIYIHSWWGDPFEFYGFKSGHKYLVLPGLKIR